MRPDGRFVIRSALSGYGRLAVRLVLGLATFRLLYETLTPEEFGFWALLWAIFGYGILLDFGFGHAAQKRVAELSVRRDWARLSRVLSSMVGLHIVLALLAAAAGMAMAGVLIDLFQVGADNRERFQVVLRVFLAGAAIAFPLGLFQEVLHGQQRITTANTLATLSLAANFVAVVAVVVWDLGLLTLVILTLLCVIVPYAVGAWTALRHMPEVRLRPARLSLEDLVESARFGFQASLNLVGHLLRHKTDPPVIAAILGVSAVASYQPGSRVAELFGMVTRQIADVLSPAAAHFHAAGDTVALRRWLVDGLRFSVLAATPLFMATSAYLVGLLRLLTGLEAPDAEMIAVGRLLLLWYYALVLTHWVFKRMFLMAGQERRMMWHGAVEAGISLLLGAGLTYGLGSVRGVAWGALLPTLGFGWLLLWGWAAREAGLSRLALFRSAVARAWLACLPMLALVAAFRLQPWWTSGRHPAALAAEMATVLAVGGWGVWRLGLSAEERNRLRALRRRGIYSIRQTTSSE